MKILISSPNQIDNEEFIINEEVRANSWDVFHLRKPNWDEERIIKLYDQLNEKVKEKTIIHCYNNKIDVAGVKGYHLSKKLLDKSIYFDQSISMSCHSFEEVETLEGKVNYCFLSPIFDSISKPGYSSRFEKETLRKFLRKKRSIKIIGLGGVTEDNYEQLINMGFDGGAFLGSVWSKYE